MIYARIFVNFSNFEIFECDWHRFCLEYSVLFNLNFHNMNEENENWRDVVGYEGLYKVSNLGNVKNCLSGRILKSSNDKDGYKLINFRKNGVYKTYKVHRIVAQAFIPNPQNLPFVNHKDENKANNRVSNLEFCTNYYNIHYGTCIERISKKLINRKDLSKSVFQYDKNGNFITEYPSLMEATRKTGIDVGAICRVCQGKQKTAGNFVWKYKVDCFFFDLFSER